MRDYSLLYIGLKQIKVDFKGTENMHMPVY